MQGIMIASSPAGTPILSTRLSLHSQTLMQQALEALSSNPQSAVAWFPLLSRPAPALGSHESESSSSSGDDNDEDVNNQASVWAQEGPEPSSSSKKGKSKHQQEGAVACAVRRNNVMLVTPVSADVEPLLPFAFLEALIAVLEDYFGPISEGIIKESFDLVLQILEEVFSAPHPMLTDASALKELIPPVTLFNKMIGAATSALAPSHHDKNSPAHVIEARHTLSSPIPWRRQGIRHQSQEAYFDLCEELAAIVDKNGQLVSADVWGRVDAKCRLSGMPDLSMHLTSPDLLQDCCFHPCIRLSPWTTSKTLSFVPPDGQFVLMEYRLAKPTSATVLPLRVKPRVTVGSAGGSFQFVISSTQAFNRPLEHVKLKFELGKNAGHVQATLTGGRPASSATTSFRNNNNTDSQRDAEPNTGRWEFVEGGTLAWYCAKMSAGDTPVVLQGTWESSVQPCPRPSCAANASFEAPLCNVSGIQVSSLKVVGAQDGGQVYKGVRGMLSSKSIDFRW